MDKKTTPSLDIPPELADRPPYKKLTPDEERAFLREQAMYAAAYRRWGDPVALWEALSHVWRSRQTVPDWLRAALYVVIMQGMTPNEARRFRERWQFAMRYTLVRNCLAQVDERTGKKMSQDRAADVAYEALQAESDTMRDKADAPTIKGTFRKIRDDLKQRGHESEWRYYVGDEGAG
jgi:hypothetical protein